MDETEKQAQNTHEILEAEKIRNKAEHLASWQYKKGQSGNPGGRPAGKSLKQYAKEKLASMTDEEREEFLNGIDKKVLWEMAEDKAGQGVNVTGEIISKVISVDE